MIICNALSDIPVTDTDRVAAFKLGIVRAKGRGSLGIGDVVIHESIEIQMTIKAIEGDEAVLWTDNDESTIVRVPHDELIDHTVLFYETISAFCELLLGDPSQPKQ